MARRKVSRAEYDAAMKAGAQPVDQEARQPSVLDSLPPPDKGAGVLRDIGDFLVKGGEKMLSGTADEIGGWIANATQPAIVRANPIGAKTRQPMRDGQMLNAEYRDSTKWTDSYEPGIDASGRSIPDVQPGDIVKGLMRKQSQDIEKRSPYLSMFGGMVGQAGRDFLIPGGFSMAGQGISAAADAAGENNSDNALDRIAAGGVGGATGVAAYGAGQALGKYVAAPAAKAAGKLFKGAADATAAFAGGAGIKQALSTEGRGAGAAMLEKKLIPIFGGKGTVQRGVAAAQEVNLDTLLGGADEAFAQADKTSVGKMARPSPNQPLRTGEAWREPNPAGGLGNEAPPAWTHEGSPGADRATNPGMKPPKPVKDAFAWSKVNTRLNNAFADGEVSTLQQKVAAEMLGDVAVEAERNGGYRAASKFKSDLMAKYGNGDHVQKQIVGKIHDILVDELDSQLGVALDNPKLAAYRGLKKIYDSLNVAQKWGPDGVLTHGIVPDSAKAVMEGMKLLRSGPVGIAGAGARMFGPAPAARGLDAASKGLSSDKIQALLAKPALTVAEEHLLTNWLESKKGSGNK